MCRRFVTALLRLQRLSGRRTRNTAWVERTRARCERFGATPTFIWMRCDAETMQTYLRRRGAARDTTKLDSWDEYVQRLDLTFEPSFEHVIVENSVDSRPLQTQATSLLTHVRAAAG